MKFSRNFDDRLVAQSSSRLFKWDPALVEELIEDSRCKGFQPSCLILGQREASLLRRHLGITFGPATAQSLTNTYYLGLEIVENPAPSLLCLGSRLSAQTPAASPSQDYFSPSFFHSRWRFTG